MRFYTDGGLSVDFVPYLTLERDHFRASINKRSDYSDQKLSSKLTFQRVLIHFDVYLLLLMF